MHRHPPNSPLFPYPTLSRSPGVARREPRCGPRDQRVVLGRHVEAVLVHQCHAIDLDAAQLERREHDVEHRDLVLEHAAQLVVGLLDRSAGRDQGNTSGHWIASLAPPHAHARQVSRDSTIYTVTAAAVAARTTRMTM